MPGLPSAQGLTLDHWWACGLCGSGGEYGPDRLLDGDSAAEFWRQAGQRCRSGATLWLVCDQAALCLALLGAWQRIDAGELTLPTSDGGRRSCRQDGRPRRPPPLLILEDPPLAIDLRVRGASGKVRVLDFANYAFPGRPEGEAPADTVLRLARAMRRIIHELRQAGLGGLQHTAASQALYSYRHAHLTGPVYCSGSEAVLGMERDAYYGGRCEAYRLGAIPGPTWHLDVTAMYPAVYGSCKVPMALRGVEDRPSAETVDYALRHYACLARVTVETDEPAYPVRWVDQGITVYPIGTYATTLAGPELADAHEHGRLRSVERIQWYDQGPELQSYARAVLALRARCADCPEAQAWVKALGVTLVGKLGQRLRWWQDRRTTILHERWDHWYVRVGEGRAREWRSVEGRAQVAQEGPASYYAVPAMAAWVTSAARWRLLWLIRQAGWEHVWYTDTDSLIVDRHGLDALHAAGLVRDGEPGYLRLVRRSAHTVIHGLKHYSEDGRVVHAGANGLSRASDAPPGRSGDRVRLADHPRAKRRPEAITLAGGPVRPELYRHGTVLPDGRVAALVMPLAEEG